MRYYVFAVIMSALIVATVLPGCYETYSTQEEQKQNTWQVTDYGVFYPQHGVTCYYYMGSMQCVRDCECGEGE